MTSSRREGASNRKILAENPVQLMNSPQEHRYGVCGWQILQWMYLWNRNSQCSNLRRVVPKEHGQSLLHRDRGVLKHNRYILYKMLSNTNFRVQL